MSITKDRNYLYWQCRRGMRELDILLQGFLEKCYDDLSSTDKEAFNSLLSYPDSLLLEYLMGRMSASDRALSNVITGIRNAATD